MFEELPKIEIPESPQLFCCDCANLIGRRVVHETAKTWKCGANQNLKNISKDLVTGMNLYKFHNETCYDARENESACGSQGVWFVKYEYTQANPNGLNLGGRKQVVNIDKLLGELDNL